MRADTNTTAPRPDGPDSSTSRQPAYGAPSPALLALADRGLARFLHGAGPEEATTGAPGADSTR